MNTERLLRLAEHLETVVAKVAGTFAMASWRDRNECGMTACAFGHACSIPEFRAAGLVMADVEDGGGQPFYRGHAGFTAAQAFFDLDLEQAYYLFADERYPGVVVGPLDVATHIRELVAGKAVGA